MQNRVIFLKVIHGEVARKTIFFRLLLNEANFGKFGTMFCYHSFPLLPLPAADCCPDIDPQSLIRKGFLK